MGKWRGVSNALLFDDHAVAVVGYDDYHHRRHTGPTMHLAEIVFSVVGFGVVVHGWIAARRARETDPTAPEEIKRLQDEVWKMGRVAALMELFMGFGLLALVAPDVLGGTTIVLRFWPWITAAIFAGFAATAVVGFVRLSRRRKILQESEGRRLAEWLKRDEDATSS